MTSELAAENIMKTLNRLDVDGRKITCRYCRPGDEKVFVDDIWEENCIPKDSKQKKAVLYIGNLPSDATKVKYSDTIMRDVILHPV